MIATLRPAELEQLTPVIGALARLLARNPSPGAAELRALLEGAGLAAGPARLAEMEYWASLLVQARTQASEGAAPATVEALMERGLPEASAVLAVAAVTRALRPSPGDEGWGAEPDPGVPSPNHAARPPRDVRGAPRTAVSASSSSRVDFTSPFLDRVRPMETEQRLVDARPTLSVAPDGSGDCGSLAAALASAEPGATIRLARGIHYVRRGLLLSHAVTLVGDGMDVTEIVADEGAFVLRSTGSGLVGLTDVTVRWTGPASYAADVVVIAGGELRSERCRFTGAIGLESSGGAGLRIAGQAHGSVRSCRMEGNGSGIEVLGEATAVLQENICHNNRGFGIRYAGDAGGLARGNNCAGNWYDGIAVEQSATPALEENSCEGNGWSGVACYGRVEATIRSNICSGNQHSGIHVGEQAQPILEGNDCRENRDSGISYGGSSGGAAVDNHCTNNRKYGICAAYESEPLLDNNELRDNGDSGIAYFGRSAGPARRNTSSGNAHYGIFVGDQAGPELEGNVCQHNAWSGLAYFGNARGAARRNRCSNNGKRGIYVAARARPLLEDNTNHRNKLASDEGRQCSPSR